MTSELKPCPFCGGADLKSGGDDKVVGVYCMTCQAQSPNHYGSYDWNTRAVPDVPELVTEAHLYFPKDQQGKRSVADIKKYDPAKPEFWVSDAAKQEYEIVPLVSRPKAAEIIAAKDKEIERLKNLIDGDDCPDPDKIDALFRRAEAAEAKLAQYEAQEPIAWRHPEAGWTDVSKAEVAVHCKHGTQPQPLYASPAPAADLKEKSRHD